MQGGNGRKEPLTARAIDAWIKRPREKQARRKLADGGGLYLVRLPSGAATWQYRYRLNKAERTFSIGPWPTVTLAKAREALTVAKATLKGGGDPVTSRRVERAKRQAEVEKHFRELALRWLAKERAGWSEIHYRKSKRALERDAFPTLGALPVADITPVIVSKVIEDVQARGVRDTAAKILQHVTAVFRYAAAQGLRDDNPAEAAVEVLQRAPLVKHRPAVLALPELGAILRHAEAAPITPPVRMCHRLIAYTATRIANASAARWTDFDFKRGVWTIPRDQMKVRGRHHPHRVMLPTQVARDLTRWQEVSGGKGYVFEGMQGRAHVSREAIEKALRVTMGLSGKHSPHGWRSSFSTLTKESGLFENEVVDLALDHVHDTDVARAYDRGERLAERVRLAQWWADQLEAAERVTAA